MFALIPWKYHKGLQAFRWELIISSFCFPVRVCAHNPPDLTWFFFSYLTNNIKKMIMKMIIKVGKGFILINISTGMGGGSVWLFAFFPFKLTIQMSGPLNINWVQQIKKIRPQNGAEKTEMFQNSLDSTTSGKLLLNSDIYWIGP